VFFVLTGALNARQNKKKVIATNATDEKAYDRLETQDQSVVHKLNGSQPKTL